MISRNGHSRYQEIDHGLIFCEQGIKKDKVIDEESRENSKTEAETAEKLARRGSIAEQPSIGIWLTDLKMNICSSI